ncbi:NAD-dependent epimerase/dehydratase family protein [Mycobacterium branderi]|uniref:Epimerase n=1 Tax=Mycobacterium branderi TaxID=43348 RepID=A0A7I7W831_9MYCO|nr:GDP-mannose 4,6-dehydratase [Mycobacterium branderi]MCV7235078.1 GDP-mannose 4,6-dehydratase [Mycobacterium branderi]ORA29844.1 epimerase [Mycobacterium branderi]BBZ13052.1 UDP-glucose 4-epimerase [Mycobacterium branderi]
MSNVLVTGGYGFIGSHLVSALLRRGDTVTVFDLAKDTRDSAVDFDRHANFRFVRGDVTDLSALEKALIPGVDTVFHLAAVVGVKRYLEDPLQVIDVNVTGTRNVLELSQRHGAHVVLASTSEVFGKNPNPPFAEDDDRVLGSTRTARWSYSTSKAMAEHLAFAMHTTYGLRVTVVRYFNVYGPRQHPIFVISRTIHRILNNRRPLLYDAGEQTRCFTYVDDAIAGTLLASESKAAVGQAFNIGSMTETTVRDVVALAIKIANVDSVSSAESIDTAAHYGARYEDIPRRIPDSTKAQRELGWRLEVDLEEGIRRTIDWARANPWYLL